jgi:hypothetical protein
MAHGASFDAVEYTIDYSRQRPFEEAFAAVMKAGVDDKVTHHARVLALITL